MAKEFTYDKKEFVPIKDFPRYVINRSGVVIDIEEMTYLSGWINNSGYLNYGLYYPRKAKKKAKRHMASAHRLVALTFIPTSKDTSVSIVNHIDGDKFNNWYENLEWCTYQENQWHAGKLGLTNRCVPITVIDVDDLETRNFPSIKEYALVLGESKDTVNYWLKKCEENSRLVTPFRSQIRRGYDATNWDIPDDIERALQMHGYSKGVRVRYLLEDRIEEFEKLSDLGESLGVASSTVSKWTSLPNQPVLPGLIQLQPLVEEVNWREVTDPYLELMENFPSYRVVKVRHLDTEEIKFYDRAILCAKAYGIKATALNYRLMKGKGKTFDGKYQFAYYQNDF